jgi:hypothetical protein
MCKTPDVVHVALEQVGAYLAAYVTNYRDAYEHLTTERPKGAGYPKRSGISPYLDNARIECQVAADGWIIVDYAGEPRNERWYIAGGPGMVIDYEPTVVPYHIRQQMSALNPLGKDIGLYRIVSQKELPLEVWTGSFPTPAETSQVTCAQKPINIARYHSTLDDLLARLTFGVTSVVDLQIPDDTAPFWLTRKIRNLGFTTADRRYHRFFRYIEIGRHLAPAAWDPRSVVARVGMDIRWDYGSNIGDWQYWSDIKAGSITVLGPKAPSLEGTLAALAEAISGLSDLLDAHSVNDENLYHQFLHEHRILLDVYGTVKSKPRFMYPEGDSPIGKKYVEPDFIVTYPDQTYRLIELERPGKGLDTVRGEPRADLTQSAFQIGEWRDYISRFSDRLQNDFPGLAAGNYRTTIIISRDDALKHGADINRYLSLVRNTVAADEILTYDGLLNRARAAYVQLAALTA